MSKKLVSIIISAYNEEGNIDKLYSHLFPMLQKFQSIDYEIIFINDFSSDNTLVILKNLALKNSKIKIINFARNFGHEIAMTAGLDYCKGDAAIFMDADLQHPPEVVEKIINKWLEGYEVVITNVINYVDKWGQKGRLMKIMSKIFYKIFSITSDIKISDHNPDFRLIGKKYIEVLRGMREHNRMFRGMLNWLGTFEVAEIDFIAPERFSGTTKYNWSKSFRLAIDSILQFSTKPLRISIYLSLICAAFAFIFAAWAILSTAHTDHHLGITCLILTIASLQFMIMAIIGEYVGKIHLESKNRPLYFAEFITYENNKRDDL